VVVIITKQNSKPLFLSVFVLNVKNVSYFYINQNKQIYFQSINKNYTYWTQRWEVLDPVLSMMLLKISEILKR
jgi:beta-lactamase class A